MGSGNITQSDKKRQDRHFFSPYIKGPVFARCPFVTTIHDLLFLVTPEYTGTRYKLYNTVFRAIGGFISKRAAAIITDSEYSRKDIMRIFKINGKKINVIPIGVSEKYCPIKDQSVIEEVKNRYGIEQKYILYVGNFKPHKNVHTLIKAYNRLPNEIKDDYQLVLGGKKDRFYIEIGQLIGKLKIKQNVVFTDFISEEHLPVLYSGAEMFVFPSLYEGFGLPILEAMACGIPVISSDSSSLPEVVGDAGILVDAKSVKGLSRAISTVLQDDKLRDELRLQILLVKPVGGN